MGIYDRDYYREEHRGPGVAMPRSAVGLLIAVNVAIYALAALYAQDPAPYSQLMGHLAVRVDSLTQSFQWWRFLTYGFAHVWNPMHIIFNMLGLWFLGRDVENRYGTKEFLGLYLLMIVTGGVAWAAVCKLQGVPGAQPAVGASAAITGIVVLYACNFPHRTLLLFGIVPMPAWLLGVFVVASDMWGSFGRPIGEGGQIAFEAHLGGAATAGLYFWFGRRLTDWIDVRRWRLRSSPWLRVHRGEDEPRRESGLPDDGGEKDADEQVDRILEKIHRLGEASLTRKERRILESASRRYQERRRRSERI